MITLKTILSFVAFIFLVIILAKSAITITNVAMRINSKANEKLEAIRCSFLLQQSHYNLTSPNQNLVFKCSKEGNKILSFSKREISLLVTPNAINDEISNIGAYENGHYK